MQVTLNRLKALSDGNRLRVVYALMNCDELCACQITELLQVTGATVSRHLSLMVSAGILDSRKSGRWRYYSLCSSESSSALFAWLRGALEVCDWSREYTSRLSSIVTSSNEEFCKLRTNDGSCGDGN